MNDDDDTTNLVKIVSKKQALHVMWVRIRGLVSHKMAQVTSRLVCHTPEWGFMSSSSFIALRVLECLIL